MPLESLNNEQINIHDLTLEQEKKPITLREKLEGIKNAGFFADEKDQWIDSLESESPKRIYHNNLLEINIESYFDASAKDKFDKVRKPEWDNAHDMLLYFLTEFRFHPDVAKKGYLEYKKIKYQDLNDSRDGWRANSGPFYDVYVQLLGIICEEKINHNLASKKLNLLKKNISRHYDPKKNEWGVTTDDRLMAVLCEALFDKEKAKDQFKKLRATSNDGYWAEEIFVEPYDKKYFLHKTKDQLLGILCEQELGEPESDIASQTPPLPEGRKY